MDHQTLLQEITIMSLHIVKFLGRPWSLIAAAFLINVGSPVAADSAGDVQQQMRELLAGRVATQSAPPSERRADRAQSGTGDAQEFARRLLLGVSDSGAEGIEPTTRPDSAGAPVQLSVQKGVLVRGDVQAMARRLLRGEPNAAGS
jgi:hypothetical protein